MTFQTTQMSNLSNECNLQQTNAPGSIWSDSVNQIEPTKPLEFGTFLTTQQSLHSCRPACVRIMWEQHLNGRHYQCKAGWQRQHQDLARNRSPMCKPTNSIRMCIEPTSETSWGLSSADKIVVELCWNTISMLPYMQQETYVIGRIGSDRNRVQRQDSRKVMQPTIQKRGIIRTSSVDQKVMPMHSAKSLCILQNWTTKCCIISTYYPFAQILPNAL